MEDGAMGTTVQRPIATPGKYGLEIAGSFAGWLVSAEGGQAFADVIQEPAGPDLIVRKHIGKPKYEDITLTFGTGMSKGFWEWVKATFDHKPARQNGALLAADFNNKPMERLNFQNALITEIGFPVLDASSKDAAKMTVRFAPERTQRAPGAGAAPAGANVQKKWLSSNFRLQIDGLDCTRVNKINALVVNQAITENTVGEAQRALESGKLEIPNLAITLPQAQADDFYNWHEDFVIKGNNGATKEKNGTLMFLPPDMTEALFTLNLLHLGIFRLALEETEAAGDGIRRLKAEMYCEEMKFSFAAPAP
jgi:hypothetical protein